VRIEPTGYQVFPEYDMRRQFDCMRLLASADLPVPRMYWLEPDDRTVLGAPFYVMGRVAAPRRQTPWAMPRPMPEPAPVTRATRPSRRLSS